MEWPITAQNYGNYVIIMIKLYAKKSKCFELYVYVKLDVLCKRSTALRKRVVQPSCFKDYLGVVKVAYTTFSSALYAIP